MGLFTCITGVSGSGKSTLINDTLFPIAQRQLNGATIAEPAPYRDIQGLEHFDKVIDIDQSPIGRTPRSNPATYTGVFTPGARAVRRRTGVSLTRLYAGAL
ncbi:excinuclease ABC subunit A [Klebsiella pneumoniae subsp. pneumoniae]|nr:excinuclease ABC subunit A [Klebsiella pneumoniae subsp. pneumoniae]